MIPAFKTTLGYVPKQGSRGLPFTCNFTALVNQVTQDFLVEQGTAMEEFFQSLWLDNSKNALPFSIAFPAMGQILTAKANTQGYYPIFVPNGKLSFVATMAAVGNSSVPLIFSNIFINPTVWSVV